MNKKLMFCAAIGAVVGAAVVQTGHLIADRSTHEAFGQRLRCKALADKYVKESTQSISLSRVEFSHSRGSCIASISEQLGLGDSTAIELGLKPPVDHTSMFKVVDLLTGEGLITRTCTSRNVPSSDNDECAKTLQEIDEAFEKNR
jgi:hypothetical protein